MFLFAFTCVIKVEQFRQFLRFSNSSFRILSISYRHFHQFLSKYFLTCIQAHKCVRHSLTIGRVLYLSARQRSHTQSPRQCLVSGAGNIAVYITRSNSPDINPVDYTICGIAQCLTAGCGQNVIALNQHLSKIWYGVEQSIVDSAISEWRISLRSCCQLKENILSKCCDNIYN